VAEVVIRNICQLLLDLYQGRCDIMYRKKGVLPRQAVAIVERCFVTIGNRGEVLRLGPGIGNPSLRMSDQRGQLDRAWEEKAPLHLVRSTRSRCVLVSPVKQVWNVNPIASNSAVPRRTSCLSTTNSHSIRPTGIDSCIGHEPQNVTDGISGERERLGVDICRKVMDS
jgi:hypothetical protein